MDGVAVERLYSTLFIASAKETVLVRRQSTSIVLATRRGRVAQQGKNHSVPVLVPVAPRPSLSRTAVLRGLDSVSQRIELVRRIAREAGEKRLGTHPRVQPAGAWTGVPYL